MWQGVETCLDCIIEPLVFEFFFAYLEDSGLEAALPSHELPSCISTCFENDE